jgi:hypothetical protein
MNFIKSTGFLMLIILLNAKIFAGGFLIVMPDAHSNPNDFQLRPGQVNPALFPLESRSTKIETRIFDQTATTTIDQVFFNPTGRRLEAYFLFPVPKDVVISKFTMNINGKMQEAELLDAAKANYDNARRTAAQNTRSAFTGFYGGLASVKAYEAAERSTSSALDSSTLGFQVGTLINIDVLIALDTLITTRSQLQQARYNTILNAIKLKAHAAALSDEDLIAINTLLR